MKKSIIFVMILSIMVSLFFAQSITAESKKKSNRIYIDHSRDHLDKKEYNEAERDAAKKKYLEKQRIHLRKEQGLARAKELAAAAGNNIAAPQAITLSAQTSTFYAQANVFDWYELNGEVKNTGSSGCLTPQIWVTLYDGSGKELTTSRAFIVGGSVVENEWGSFTNALYSGDTGFFSFSASVDFSDVASYTYEFDWETYDYSKAMATLSFDGTPNVRKNVFSRAEISGQIQNTNNYYLTYFTKVYFAIYNSSGRVIDVGSTWADGPEYSGYHSAIWPGTSEDFEHNSGAAYSKYSSYKYAFEWNGEVQVHTPPKTTLTVQSTPTTGAYITVLPTDENGNKSGDTNFTRKYLEGSWVFLTAPSTLNGGAFIRWTRNGTEYSASRSISVYTDADYTMVAVYADPPATPTYTLTVKSSGASNVDITVSKTDNNSNKNGTTDFTRVYDENSLVTLTAPSTSGGKYFSKWHSDGSDYTTESLLVGMLTNKTATAYYTDSPPEIAVNRTALYFTYVLGGSMPAPQSFIVSNSGGGTLDWAISESYDAVSVSPTSGSGGTIITVNVDPGTYGYPAGNYYGTLNISATGASGKTVAVYMSVIDAAQNMAPIGDFATPADGSLVSSSVAATGWVVDDTGVASVGIYYKENGVLKFIGDAVFVDGARDDITATYPAYPGSYKAGWGYMLLTNFLPNGDATYELHAVATDSEGKQTNLGSKTITVNNAGAVKPFGAIDTPAQGGTASGSSFSQVGWVLTPMPNTVPIDGSGINVYVNGIYLGHPQYNIYRADIATYFPGYNNTDGSLAKYILDTTAYTTGNHSIFWIATDNAGNADGIGSRFFTIENSGAERTAPETGQTERLSPVTAATTSQTRRSGSVIDTIPMDYAAPVTFKNGSDDALSQSAMRGEDGVAHIRMKENQRVVIDLSGLAVPGSRITGYTVTGSGLSRLPLGSTLDSGSAKFFWAPPLGYMGTYTLSFIVETETGKMRKDVRVTIDSKFEKK